MQFSLSKKNDAAGAKSGISSIFKLDDEEETDQKFIPRGAKMSKNLGRDTPSGVGIKTFPPHHPRTLTPHWSQDSKQHHLHRPVDKYFSDKQEQQRKQEEEERMVRMAEKSQEDAKIAEIEKIANLIREEKNKIRFCFLCNRKFASLQHLEAHETQSELHKKNLELKKSEKMEITS